MLPFDTQASDRFQVGGGVRLADTDCIGPHHGREKTAEVQRVEKLTRKAFRLVGADPGLDPGSLFPL